MSQRLLACALCVDSPSPRWRMFAQAVTLVCGVFNALTLIILMRFSVAHRDSMRVLSFQELCGAMLGARARVAATFSVLVGCVGAIIGFQIIMADLAQPALAGWAGDDAFISSRAVVIQVWLGSVAGWWFCWFPSCRLCVAHVLHSGYDRSAYMQGFTWLLIFPFSFVRSFDKLRGSSVGASASVREIRS